MKYKVGDVVRVIEEYPGHTSVASPYMPGTIATITKVYIGADYYLTNLHTRVGIPSTHVEPASKLLKALK